MDVRNFSEVGRLTRLLLKRPEDSFLSQENLDVNWKEYNYLGPPDYVRACAEYDAFAALLSDSVPEIHYLKGNPDAGLDSLYVRDALLIAEGGAVFLNMSKPQRRGEPAAASRVLSELGIPVLGEIREPGKVEGGDVVWFDRNTLAIGQGYRTNAEGIRQLTEILSDSVSSIQVVPLPHWKGPGDVLHLMSLISPLDQDLALVFPPSCRCRSGNGCWSAESPCSRFPPWNTTPWLETSWPWGRGTASCSPATRSPAGCWRLPE